jgi:uncharacterized protein YkwD
MAQPTARTRTLPLPHGPTTAVLLSVALAAGALAAATPVRATGGDGLRQEANEYRVDKGHLMPVAASDLLDDIAIRRAGQMVAADKLEHDIDYVFDRLNASGVCWKGFGEIIAWERGYPDYSYERTMGMWWDSPTHHAVMMGADYNAAGGAWKRAEDGAHYSVMIFAELCGDPVASSTSVPPLKPERTYNPDRPMVFVRGTFTGYRLGSNGEVTSKKTVRFGSVHRTTSAGRSWVDGRSWLKVSGGSLWGFWVRETSKSYVRGASAIKEYDPDRQLVVLAGRYTAYKFGWLGGTRAAKDYRTTSRTKLRVSSWAMINGRPYYRVASGRLDGYWLRDSDKTFLK